MSFPDSSAMIMFNADWMSREMKKGRMPDFALDLAMSAMSVDNFRDTAVESISGLSSIVIQKMELEHSAQVIEKLEFHALLGSALALVERADGAQVEGYIHPSIWNAFYPAKQTDLEGINAQVAAAKCVEIGYYLAAGYFKTSSEACERLKPLRD